LDPIAYLLVQTPDPLLLFLDFKHLLISNALPFTFLFCPTLPFFPDLRLPFGSPSEAKLNVIQAVFDLPPFAVTPYERNTIDIRVSKGSVNSPVGVYVYS